MTHPSHTHWCQLCWATLFATHYLSSLVQMLDVRLPFEEVDILQQNLEYLQRACNLPSVPFAVHKVSAAEPVPGSGTQPLPGKPAPRIETRAVQQQ